jgi:serine protease Do
MTPPGRDIKVQVIRDRKPLTLTVTTARRPSEAELTGSGEPTAPEPDRDVESKMSRLGMSVSPLTPAVAKQLGVPDTVKGVVISQVDPNGPAAEAGIPRGSIILRVGRTPTPTVRAFQDAIAKLGEKDPIILLINVAQAGSGNKRTDTVVMLKPTE